MSAHLGLAGWACPWRGPAAAPCDRPSAIFAGSTSSLVEPPPPHGLGTIWWPAGAVPLGAGRIHAVTLSAGASATAAIAAASAGRRSRRCRRAPVVARRALDVKASDLVLQQETSLTTPIDLWGLADGDSPADEVIQQLMMLFPEVLECKPPMHFTILLKVLEATGWKCLQNKEWKDIGGDLHPLLLPLATQGKGEDIEVIGLLSRAASGKKLQPDEFLIASQKPHKYRQLSLHAVSPLQYIRKCAEEAHFYKFGLKDQKIIRATKGTTEIQFGGGDVAALDKWLLAEVGPFPDVYRNLAKRFIDEGDVRSALVTADNMKEAFGASWGFPHAYLAKMYRTHWNPETMGPLEDALSDYMAVRDEGYDQLASHAAMRCFNGIAPLWTLDPEDGSSEALLKLAHEAQVPGMMDMEALRTFYLRRSIDDQRRAVRTGNISLGSVALAKAQAFLDAVCCDWKTYRQARPQLLDIYDEVPGAEGTVNMLEYYWQS